MGYKYESKVEAVPRKEGQFTAIVTQIDEETKERTMLHCLSGFNNRNAAQHWADDQARGYSMRPAPALAQAPETD